MHKGTMSVKKETILGQECIVLDVQEEEGKAKAILSKTDAVALAEGLLRMSWKCGFVILKDDDHARAERRRSPDSLKLV